MTTICIGPECDRPAKIRGMCDAHDTQRARGQVLRPLRVNQPHQPCTGPKCDHMAPPVHGLCPAHLRQQRKGKTLTPLRTSSQVVAAKAATEEDGLPAGWFKPSIRKPATPSGQMKLAPETIGPPLPTPGWMRRHAMGTALSRARSPEEAADFMSMIFGIENANTNPNKKAVSL